MIALFETESAAQAYCDERSKAHGLPKTAKHPRTGKIVVIASAWDTPRLHPDGSGRAWCTIDEDGDVPLNAEIVKELPEDWIPEGPTAKVARMTEKEAEADSDPFILEMVRAKAATLEPAQRK